MEQRECSQWEQGPGPSLRCYGDVLGDSDGPGVRAAHEET